MAKITLTIEADDAGDLAGALYGLVNMSQTTRPARGYTVEDEGREMTAEEAEMYARDEEAHPEDYSPQTPAKRTRRTKAQIAEDNARAAGGGSTAAAATPASGAGTAAGTQTTGDASTGKDPFGDQLKEVAAEAATDGECTKAMVSDALQASIAKRGAPATQALLIQQGGGAKSLGQIDPSAYADVRAALLAD